MNSPRFARLPEQRVYPETGWLSHGNKEPAEKSPRRREAGSHFGGRADSNRLPLSRTPSLLVLWQPASPHHRSCPPPADCERSKNSRTPPVPHRTRFSPVEAHCWPPQSVLQAELPGANAALRFGPIDILPSTRGQACRRALPETEE